MKERKGNGGKGEMNKYKEGGERERMGRKRKKERGELRESKRFKRKMERK